MFYVAHLPATRLTAVAPVNYLPIVAVLALALVPMFETPVVPGRQSERCRRRIAATCVVKLVSEQPVTGNPESASGLNCWSSGSG